MLTSTRLLHGPCQKYSCLIFLFHVLIIVIDFYNFIFWFFFLSTLFSYLWVLIFSYATFQYNTLRKRCPYSELFLSVFSRIQTECGEMLRISPYWVRIRENTDQNNSKYRHFSRSNNL